MLNLKRELAPISGAAWKEIDDEAKKTLGLHLAGRKVVDFVGPLGWDTSALNLGRVEGTESAPHPGVDASIRRVQPLVELRTAIELSRHDLEDVDRGAADPDLQAVTEAATRLARAEDSAIFNGYAPAGIEGIVQSTSHPPLEIPEDYAGYPRLVTDATSLLRAAGVDGPYGIALGARCWAGLMHATGPGGFPVIDNVRRLIDGPVVWAPVVDGAVVLSLRGGDFELTVGQDVSIGYQSHDDANLRLRLLESFTFRVLTPEAAVRLRYPKGD